MWPPDLVRAPARLLADGVRIARTLGTAPDTPTGTTPDDTSSPDSGGARSGTGCPGTARREGARGAVVARDRLAVRMPGADRADAEGLRRDTVEAVRELPGVAWAAVNAPLQRLVVGRRAPVSDPHELLAVVDAVRAVHAEDVAVHGEAGRWRPLHGVTEPNQPSGEPPDDGAPLARTLIGLVADATGLVLATAEPVTRRVPGPVEAAWLIALVETQPRLRAVVEQALGRSRADTVIGVTAGIAQGVSRGRAGLAVDVALRMAQLSELWSRREAWHRDETRLFRNEVSARADPVTVERAAPLPEGPVERYAPRTVGVALAGAVLALAAGGGPRHAAALALATLPKAAGTGREMYAVQLGRMLARRGVHVMERPALRRLDRVDVVVLDAEALITGRRVVAEVIPLRGSLPEQVHLRAHDLFTPEALDVPAADGAWTLGPLDRLQLRGRTGARERRRAQAPGVVAVLGLARAGRLEALVVVTDEHVDSVDALVAAARRSGTELVVAGGPLPSGRQITARELPGGRRLLGSVRQLQAEGHGVLLVSRRAQALANADCGVGVDRFDGTPPWGAHVLVGDDLAAAAMLIDAVAAARAVSRRGVQLAEAASAVAAVSAATGSAAGAPARALLAVNAASACSLLQGGWAAAELTRQPLSPPVSSTPWHILAADRVLDLLDSRPDGLTSRQARSRRSPDVQVNPDPPGLARAFVEELANPLTPILAGGAALSAAVGSFVDAGVVVGASAFGAFAGAVQRTLTSRAVADLLTRSAVIATVRRDGEPVRLPADQLVPGDVVQLVPGDVVPADCRVLSEAGLEVDESSLTGESFPVAKFTAPVVAADPADRTSLVYEGTTVAGGRSVAVVVATGSATEAGRGMATAAQAAPVSGVEARLSQITRTTLPIALASGAGVVAAGLLRGRPARQTVGAGVGLAVASVPEGLPFLVGAAQLAAARRLSQQGALVRNARTIEALGRVDVLCFDKTGTLTQGRIRLAAVSDGAASGRVTELTARQRDVVAAGLRATPVAPPGRRLPHLTDRAVRDGAQELHVTEQAGAPGWREDAVLPFEPSRGYHATAGTVDGGRLLLCVKGAPEVVLARCTSWRTGAADEPLLQRSRRRIHDELDGLTRHGFRVLAVAQAHRPQPLAMPPDLTEADVDGLTFLGFLALADPVRGSAGASLDRLRDAGATLVMITGDHPQTAEAIADELGLLNGSRIVTGAEIDALDDDELTGLVPRIAVVARSTPAHKVRVVKAFQRAGRVVAMTGDGANDAAAIRLAEVGIALGRRGTPAARAAADLIVVDDRLETIVAALIEGRAMWRSVREALAILVGGNLGEIGFTLLGATVSGDSPLTARQLLLVNLLTDLVPALAIAVRRPSSVTARDLLQEGPESSLGKALGREVAARAACTVTGATLGWLAGRATGRPARARTVALASLVGTQLGQTLSVGGTNPAILAAGVGSVAVLVTVVQTPGLSWFFGCTPLGPLGWGIAAGAATAATLAPAVAPPVLRLLPARWWPGTDVERFLDPDRLAELTRRWIPADFLVGSGGGTS